MHMRNISHASDNQTCLKSLLRVESKHKHFPRTYNQKGEIVYSTYYLVQLLQTQWFPVSVDNGVSDAETSS